MVLKCWNRDSGAKKVVWCWKLLFGTRIILWKELPPKPSLDRLTRAARVCPQKHEAFGRLFGELAGHPNLKEMNKGGLFVLKAGQMDKTGSSGRGKATVADEFHTDLTCEVSPPRMSILRMVKCPQVGGDTMFVNLCAAYEVRL